MTDIHNDNLDSPPPMTTGQPLATRIKVLWGILIVVAIGISFAFFLKLLRDNTQTIPLPVLGHVPAFSLIESNGTTFTRETIKGKIWIAGFLFTTCSSVCTQMTSEMYRLKEKISDTDVVFVSITVDPEHDTPQVLKEYAELYGLPAHRWFLLTGDQKDIYKLSLEGFKLPLAKGSTREDPFIHSARLTLVDGASAIRGYYDSDDSLAMKKLYNDIQSLRRDNAHQ